jgi:2-oxoacid:acceptor oxidoreductase delta subunit (pyruvate/2-ketoisovalerate family)
MGRICYHPCEAACNRADLDEAVGINGIERFLGDMALEQGWPLPAAPGDSGKRVLVVGAGPAGLSASYQLRRLGHHVRLVDSAANLGGMMRYGIPAYRLPRAVLDAEIARIIDLGIDVDLGHAVLDVELERSVGRFDAVFLAVGAQLARRIEIPAGDSSRVLDAITLLRRVNEDDPPLLGRRVAVYGGGDTALDAARTVRRLGATDAVIVYRRNRERMPGHGEELEQALGEGVTMRWLSSVARFDPDHLVIEKMHLNEAGFPEPTGEFEDLDVDSLVLALGQDTDLSLLEHASDIQVEEGVIGVTPTLMTGERGVFAGGDAVSGQRTATVAIGHGRRAARGIDEFLSGREPASPASRQIASFEHLNTWYYADAPRQTRPELERARRANTFDEVVGGFTQANALFEARRCLSCGNCFECDNCFGVCPDNAVVKLGPGQRYEIDYDFCKGCGICVQECPCGAIEMVPEQI